MPAGRPSSFTKEVGDKICEQLARGLSMRTVCKADDMPEMVTVFRWLRTNQEFCKQYEKAKEESADALAEEMLDIADEGTNDWMQKNDPKNAGYAANGEYVQRSRLRVDTRKWIASKLKPKKYGERTTIAGDADAPLVVQSATAKEMIDAYIKKQNEPQVIEIKPKEITSEI